MRRSATLCAILLGLCSAAHATIAVGGTWETRPVTGADTNGGCYVTGSSGTDYSQQAAPQYALSGLTTAGVSATIATTSAAADMVGNCIQITAGTNFTTGFYQVLSIVAGTSITVDRNATTGVGAAGTGNIGGALQTLAKLNTAMAQGNTAWVKAEGTISLGTGVTFNFTNATTNQYPFISGYTTTRGDNGRFTAQATAGTITMILLNSSGLTLQNATLDCNSQTASTGLQLSATGSRGINVTVQNCTNSSNGGIFVNGQNTVCSRCTVTGQTAFAAFRITANPVLLMQAVAVNNSVTGFVAGTGTTFIGAISANNSGATSDCFQIGGGSQLLNSSAYNCGRDGIRVTSGSSIAFTLQNNISYGNAGFGLNFTNGPPPTGATLANFNSFGANTSGARNNITAGTDDKVLTADPFTNGPGNDFSLNNNSGAGALARGAGFPGALAVGGTGFIDMGALQHASAAASVTVGYPLGN